ncbi:MAG: ATP-binding protein [Dehalococcoidia bacterium]|nr:ATP-binding protein [Dehalococcoidia bacterium]
MVRAVLATSIYEVTTMPAAVTRRMGSVNSVDLERIIESLGTLPQPAQIPVLVMVAGLPGSGKSYFSRALAKRTGLVVVQSDAVRKILVPRPGYSPAESYLVFSRCHEALKHILDMGISVIFDATNLRNRNRKYLYNIASAVGARLIRVWVEAPPDVVFDRLRAREANRHPLDLSDATWEIYLNMAVGVQKISGEHYFVDTSKDIQPILAKIAKEIKGVWPTLRRRHNVTVLGPSFKQEVE